MAKYLLKLSVIFLLILNSIACTGGEDEVAALRKRRPPPASLPKKGTKVFLIIPAGAGAMYVSLAIAEELERLVGLADGIGSIATLAGGVSSGALAAAGLTITIGGKDDKPRYTAASLKRKIVSEKLVAKVFPETTALMDELHNVVGFTLDELEAVFLEIMSNPPKQLNTAAEAEDYLTKQVLPKVALKKHSIALKAAKLTGNATVMNAIKDLANKADIRKNALVTVIDDVLGPRVTLDDPSVAKIIAIASHDEKPVFFASSSIRNIPEPQAVGTTYLWEGLLSSAAIPGFINGADNVVFSPNNAVIAPLVDGFFAKGVGFDPSVIYYDIFTKEFPNEDLLIIYLGNGAPPNREFRKTHRLNNDNVFQVKGKGTITYVAIDAKIVDDDGNSLFNISQFYDNPDLQKYMQKAADKATEKGNKAFDWAVKGIKAAQGVK